jgi:hypothetical protein
VAYRTRLSIVPGNGDLAPGRSDNRAKIGGRGSPANAVADFELSGLFAGHRLILPPAGAALSIRFVRLAVAAIGQQWSSNRPAEIGLEFREPWREPVRPVA